MKKILLVSHNSGAPGGPVDKLYEYLKKDHEVFIIRHPLFPKSNLESTVKFEDVKLQFKLPALIQYPIEGIITSFILLLKLKRRPTVDLTISFDPLAYMNIYLFSIIYKSRKNVYYNLDFSRQRFKNTLMNFIYNQANIISYKTCTYFFCLSDTIIKDLDPKNLNRKKNFVIPQTVILINNNQKKKKNSLIYAGAIGENINFDFLLEALVLLKKEKIPYILDIYGHENDNGLLRLKIKQYNLEKNIFLKGPQDLVKLTQKIIPQYMIGLSPYRTKGDPLAPDYMFTNKNLTAKIVDYIVAGVPVIATKINAAFDNIESKRFGILANDPKDWHYAIKMLLTDKKLYNEYRLNGLSYAKKYDENTIFSPIFKKIL